MSSGSALLGRANAGGGSGSRGGRCRLPQQEEELCCRVQHLKGEFTDLLTEIRRRKSVSEGRVVGVGSQTEVRGCLGVWLGVVGCEGGRELKETVNANRKK